MKIILFLLFFHLSVYATTGQHLSFSLPLNIVSDTSSIEQSFDLTPYSRADFTTVAVVLEGPDLHIKSRAEMWIDDGHGWVLLQPFGEEHIENRFVSELYFCETDHVRIRIKVASAGDMGRMKGNIFFFSPTGLVQQDKGENYPGGVGNGCPCVLPPVVSRSAWGAAWNLNGSIYIPPPSYTNVTHLIVHHSAGSNSSNDWPGVVAAIFNYHVNTNGWADVGYNWLIDPNGVLYEGRGGGNNVRGAHMCAYNSNTMGVCLLGNYVNAPPPVAAMETLKKLLAWKCCDSGITPTGSGPIASYPGIMQHISGHRDGCAPNATECPGSLLYAQMPALRTVVAQYMDAVCSSSPANDLKNLKPKISPNPATDHLSVYWPDPVAGGQLYLRDMLNRTVLQQNLDAPAVFWDLDLSKVGDGAYWLHIQTHEKTFTRLIVVQN